MIEYHKNFSLESLPYINNEGLICWEEFGDIPDYEGLYQVSDLGRVKSLKFNGGKKEKVLKMTPLKSGYLSTTFHKERQQTNRTVHQLVAIVFLNHVPCKFKLVVNHINTNKLDNRAANLEIITNRENSNQKHIPSSSRFTGVSLDKKRWRAAIVINGIDVRLGSFDNELEASKYYENAVIALQNGTEINIKPPNYSSKHKGVCWNKSKNRWVSTIFIRGRSKHIGNYLTEEEAYQGRENYIKQITE